MTKRIVGSLIESLSQILNWYRLGLHPVGQFIVALLLASATAIVYINASFVVLEDRLDKTPWLFGFLTLMLIIAVGIVLFLTLRRFIVRIPLGNIPNERQRALLGSTLRNWLLIVLAVLFIIPHFCYESEVPELDKAKLASIPHGALLYASVEKHKDPAAANRLGMYMADQQDDLLAVKLFRLAAKRGLADGCYHLGLMYSQGRGVRQDEAAAAKQFIEAVSKGHMEALDALKSNKWYASVANIRAIASEPLMMSKRQGD